MTAGILIEFCGLPGTGKSTLAGRLARELGAVMLRIDEIEAAMRRNGLTEEQTGIAAYSVAHDVGANQLRRSLTVIADAVSPVEEARAGWRELARASGARHLVIETQCADRAEHQFRVETRERDIPGWAYPSWQQVERSRSAYQPRTDVRLIVDTSQTMDACEREIAAFVAQEGVAKAQAV